MLATDAPVILAGDFNAVPTDFDIYPTKSWAKDALVQPASRACFQRLLDQGWVDAIRMLHPSEPMFTFWDYKRQRWERDAGLRLDHLLLNVRWRRTGSSRLELTGRYVVEGASDHAPAWYRAWKRRPAACPNPEAQIVLSQSIIASKARPDPWPDRLRDWHQRDWVVRSIVRVVCLRALLIILERGRTRNLILPPTADVMVRSSIFMTTSSPEQHG